MDRASIVPCAESYLGLPYIIGAKGDDAFDCSGLVTRVLKKLGGPDWRYTHNAAELYRVCPAIPEADEHLADITAGAPHWPCPGVQAGDLVFYGKDGGVDHVMIVVGDGRVIGASGGDHTTTTLEEAARLHACVHFKPSVDYRKDFIGYRRFPFVVIALEG